MTGGDANAEPSRSEQAAADARNALTALAQQLADRRHPSRPMRASMQLAYRALMEREYRRLERLHGQASGH
jgi:hypothetical protein